MAAWRATRGAAFAEEDDCVVGGVEGVGREREVAGPAGDAGAGVDGGELAVLVADDEATGDHDGAGLGSRAGDAGEREEREISGVEGEEEAVVVGEVEEAVAGDERGGDAGVQAGVQAGPVPWVEGDDLAVARGGVEAAVEQDGGGDESAGELDGPAVVAGAQVESVEDVVGVGGVDGVGVGERSTASWWRPPDSSSSASRICRF